MRSDECEVVIRRIAKQSVRVQTSKHAVERMLERGITDRQMLEILRTGYVEAIDSTGQRTVCKVIKRILGTRFAGVITIIVDDDKENERLVVKTVEWED